VAHCLPLNYALEGLQKALDLFTLAARTLVVLLG
jgi:hypothetical protein